LIEKIRTFKYAFKERPAWEKGSPKRVNNLTMYGAAEANKAKPTCQGMCEQH
jgi:hypothetical protein